MSATGEVATVAGRLATFQGSQQLHKRRASSAKKKTPNSVSWPHESPSPEDLAHAGFYYKPTPGSSDNVSCFLCGKDIDGWESDDDPIREHLVLVPDCGWALNVAIAQRISSEKHQEEDPMSGPLLQARLATFRDAWPHDGKRGWKCTSKKLASAGWTYNPVPEADDCVQCFYCNCSLDGWEPKDDPWEEHHRRNPECAFFALIEESKSTKPTRAKKATKSRSTRPSRVSSRSNLTAVSDDEDTNLDNESLAEEGDTVLTTTSNSTSGRKKTIPKKAKSTRKTTKAKSLVAAQDNTGNDPFTERPEEGANETSLLGPTAPGKRAKRGRKQDPSIDSSIVEIEAPVEPEPTVKPSRKGRSKKTSIESLDASVLMQAPISEDHPKPKAKRSKKRGTNVTETTDTSLIYTADVHLVPDSNATLAKKRGSDGTVKAESSVLRPAEPKQPEIPAKSPKRATQAMAIATRDAKSTTAPAGKVKRNEKASEGPRLPDAQLATIEQGLGEEAEKYDLIHAAAGNESSTLQRSPSPQSSDAENQPPSAGSWSRTAPVPITTTERVPLAASTPSRQSPSKRNIAGGLVSSSAWQAVDVEAMFLRTPLLQAMGKENIRLEDVLTTLSSPEKKMTVEEWMLHNAHTSEDKLRAECERMIGLFESEGNKALRSLEGIQVV